MKSRVMVMAWNADAQEHFWMDYCHNRKSEKALMRELSRGIKEGAWIAWRIITIKSEGGAAITCGTSASGSDCCSNLDTGAEAKMGTSPHVDAKKFPQQGSLLGRKVNVCFHRDTRRQIGGVVVRHDISEPFIGIIRLDDGRHVLMTECQFQEQ